MTKVHPNPNKISTNECAEKSSKLNVSKINKNRKQVQHTNKRDIQTPLQPKTTKKQDTDKKERARKGGNKRDRKSGSDIKRDRCSESNRKTEEPDRD